MRKHHEHYQDYVHRLFPEEFVSTAAVPHKLTKTVTLQVTDACNLRCSYCYQIKKGTHRMSWETAKQSIDMLLTGNEYINSKTSPAIILEFIGGEPLLEIDLIDRITDYFIMELIRRDHPWKTRFRLSICSNGVLYFDEQVQRYLRKHMDSISFTVTVDGNKRLHDSCRVFPDGSGSYELAIAGVKHYMRELRGVMGSKITLCPENIAFAQEAAEALLDLGYTYIFMNCVFEKGWQPQHATTLYQQLMQLADNILKRGLENELYISIFEETLLGRPKNAEDLVNWCGGTGNMLAVDWKGGLYPCLRYMESSLGSEQPPLIIGNVYDGMMSTTEQKDCVHCLQCITRKTQSTEECFNCPIAEGCAWCSAYNYQVFGTPDKRATFICEMHKARVLANVYYWNQAYLKNSEKKVFRNHVPDEWALPIIGRNELNKLKELEGRALACLQ